MSEQSCFSQFSEEYSRISELVWDQLNGDEGFELDFDNACDLLDFMESMSAETPLRGASFMDYSEDQRNRFMQASVEYSDLGHITERFIGRFSALKEQEDHLRERLRYYSEVARTNPYTDSTS